MTQEISDAITLLEQAKQQTPEQATATVNQAIEVLLNAVRDQQAPDVDRGV